MPTARTAKRIGTQVTDKLGRVSIAIPSNGVYVVVLDPDTLPADVKLSGKGETDKTITARLGGSNFAQYQIGASR